MKHAWAIAMIAAAGLTLLAASAFALFAPPEMLDLAVQMGDRRLWMTLIGFFCVAAVTVRLVLMRRRSAEEDVSEPAPAQGGSHLR